MADDNVLPTLVVQLDRTPSARGSKRLDRPKLVEYQNAVVAGLTQPHYLPDCTAAMVPLLKYEVVCRRLWPLDITSVLRDVEYTMLYSALGHRPTREHCIHVPLCKAYVTCLPFN